LVSDPPLVLAFDTAAAHCAAALVRGDAVLGRCVEPMDRGQAERLLSLCEELLAAAGVGWADLDGIGVCVGPGNFTGLRLGVAAARGLALALDRPAAGATVFEALAAPLAGPVLVSLEDKREGRFSQAFADGAPTGAPRGGDPAALAPFPPGTVVAGFEASRLAARLGLAAGPEGTRADPAVIARIAAGRLGTAPPPAPLYLRPADAMLPAEPPPLILDAG
jgi:tRNA threonylcarbamoyl adenosine modification protein YeaZ